MRCVGCKHGVIPRSRVGVHRVCSRCDLVHDQDGGPIGYPISLGVAQVDLLPYDTVRRALGEGTTILRGDVTAIVKAAMELLKTDPGRVARGVIEAESIAAAVQDACNRRRPSIRV